MSKLRPPCNEGLSHNSDLALWLGGQPQPCLRLLVRAPPACTLRKAGFGNLAGALGGDQGTI